MSAEQTQIDVERAVRNQLYGERSEPGASVSFSAGATASSV